MMSRFIGAIIGLTASNFIYAAATSQQWDVAIEHSWFQIVAIVAVAGSFYFMPPRSTPAH